MAENKHGPARSTGPSDNPAVGDARLLTPEQVAEVLAISRTRVYEYLASQRLRSVRLGRSRRVSVGALRDFVQHLEEMG